MATAIVRHHTTSNDTTTCGITITPSVNVEWNTTNEVTCKRCLARLAKAAELALQDPAHPFNVAQDAAGLADEPTESVLPATHAVNPTNPRYTVCGTPKADVTIAPSLDDVTCPRCLVKLDGRVGDADADEPRTPKEPKAPKEPRTPKVPKEPRAPKAPKAPTVHLHDAGRSTHQTWCKIPGVTTTDASAVTCKVCRAHIDGKAPVNAVPERVKAARKAFRSFVARVAYMVFMDRDCGGDNGINWSLSHTNMAGDCYEVGRSNTTGYRVMCNASIVTTDLGQDIKQWMEEHWSCGEDK